MKQFPIIRFLVIGGLVPNILLPIFSYQFNVIANQSFASDAGSLQYPGEAEIICSGYGTTDQKEIFVNGPGGYSGFIPMFADAPPTNTSVATADTEVFMLHQSQFQEIIRVYPAIALNLLRISALQFRKMGLTA